MALIKPTTPEQWQAMAASLELISARAAMLAHSARAHRFEPAELANGLDGICTLASSCRALAGLQPQGMPS